LRTSVIFNNRKAVRNLGRDMYMNELKKSKYAKTGRNIDQDDEKKTGGDGGESGVWARNTKKR
jgi:hypothetical protein